MMDLECNRRTVLNVLSFIRHVKNDFKRLLELKDPLAVLLMACWYAKMWYYNMWWTVQRAVLECHATCLRLVKYYAEEREI
jgi:hypothetical protein